MTERDFAFFYLTVNVLTVKVNVTLTYTLTQLTAERFSCEHDECSHPVLGIPTIHLFALVVPLTRKTNCKTNFWVPNFHSKGRHKKLYLLYSDSPRCESSI